MAPLRIANFFYLLFYLFALQMGINFMAAFLLEMRDSYLLKVTANYPSLSLAKNLAYVCDTFYT